MGVWLAGGGCCLVGELEGVVLEAEQGVAAALAVATLVSGFMLLAAVVVLALCLAGLAVAGAWAIEKPMHPIIIAAPNKNFFMF